MRPCKVEICVPAHTVTKWREIPLQSSCLCHGPLHTRPGVPSKQQWPTLAVRWAVPLLHSHEGLADPLLHQRQQKVTRWSCRRPTGRE